MPRKGHKFTPEQKKRMSESHKGKKPWNKGKKGLQVAWNKDMKGYTNAGTFKKGHSQSDEAKKKMSVAKKGISLSKEHRKNISQGNKGKKIPRDVRMKISEKNRGKKRSEEAKKKMSVSKKGKPSPMKGKKGRYSEKTLKKMSLAKIGRKHSEEYKKNLSDIMKNKPLWNRGRTNVFSEETLQKIREARLRQKPQKNTVPEKLMRKMLKDLGIKFEEQIGIKEPACQPDFFIQPKILIFSDGDWIHANPKPHLIPSRTNKIYPGYGDDKKIYGMTAKDKRRQDKKITRGLKKKGYNVLRFWHSELETEPEKCLKKILKEIQKR